MYVVTLHLLAECNHLGAGHRASCKLQERKVGKSAHLSLIYISFIFLSLACRDANNHRG